ncbi:MAG: hypothetical protein LKH27_08140 [Prevotella sp.]|jgi:hypothetical protein|nr:hypothetical protein [Prevotella sp.]MCH3993032.1 hypothetical protein [Prevotella sp.]MCI1474367.1 hypothetical protein [Prevotella sp.]MCI1596077.1 hypothetical protein [Prevotella sp.]
MARQRSARVTAYSTSNYRGGRRGLTDSTTGRVSNNGRYMSRRGVYGQVRRSLGMSGG